jgi:DNA primase
VAVIGRHMELKKAGRTWKGCCVFHGERTPSFHVYPEDKHFKCYGCGVYGDVFKFLQRLESKQFPEVLRELAREVGVEIADEEEESPEQKRWRKERNEILAACDAAARYWAARLASKWGIAARRYLEERGVFEESVRRFRLGVAADEWNDLAPRLKSKGIGSAALARAGLVIEKKEKRGSYDRFRNRLMIPIAGKDGKVIGFGGRALPGSAKDDKGAKYINTPETPLYKKAKVLYGLDLAHESIRKTRSAVLVEGYFDVIGLHQAGVTNAIAVCGTALTAEHVVLLSSWDCRELTVLFDGDVAGLAALEKAGEALSHSGIGGRVAVLPSQQGKSDPDEFARANGKVGVDALLAKASSLFEYIVQRKVEPTCGARPQEASAEAKLAAVRDLKPFLSKMQAGLSRSVYESAVAKLLDIDISALRAELSSGPPQLSVAGQRRGNPRAPIGAPVRGVAPSHARAVLPGPAADALALLAAFPEALASVADEENLPALLPPGPLADLARDLIRERLPIEQSLARVAAVADDRFMNRFREETGAKRSDEKHAEHEFRINLAKAAIEAVRAEYEHLLAVVAQKGTPVPDDLAIAVQVAKRKRSDLDRRLRLLERSG